MQIQTDNVQQLRFEIWIRTERESANPVGLQSRGDQHVMHGRGRQLEVARARPDRPATVGFRLLAGAGLDALPDLGSVFQRAAGPRRILQAVDAGRRERATPLPGRDLRNPERGRNVLIRLAGAGRQHNAAPQRQALRRRR
jgi:hypothetical protein